MIGGFKIKSMFFDRDVVIRALDAKTRRALSKAGAFIRTSARSSMRRRKRPSQPGHPPSVHEGSLKRFLFFAYDQASRSVVVGPVGFLSSQAPSVLEHGGTTVITRRRGGKVERKRVVIEARPYMGPALEREAPKMPALWSGNLSSGR